jgi:predicted Holliday junction resolvase-like endonuclease
MGFEIVLATIIFLIGVVVAYIVGVKFGEARREKYWVSEIPRHRKDAIDRSRGVLKGQFSEQLAPYFPDFSFDPNECRFIGKPIDFVVFKGASQQEITEVIFVEVKSGKSKLSRQERGLRRAIEEGRVRWVEYRVPEGD